ncbi:hypothetical protein BOKEGFJH_00511 [Chlamydia avium]|uniref:UPF0056 membrane protein n=2 Tax=Chlamydia avium TaxID=1457141 RepID=W8JM62_9CHLA|nr:MarC family protein [Chlamydia avium]AHK63384.1 MarC integral membrane family protein [Chlamydia avium 10DC88]EPP37582.1 marC integral membrane family protein [Chlamydia psittaci 10_743_SC13]EPP38202.1 marC integral membrane family protein [Chlamydia avium]VVT42984.1 hypothetical protein BOKEGFJH_00511 [Chlamydia avium]
MNSVFFLFSQACILLLAADTLTNVLVLNAVLSQFSRKERLILLLRENIFALISMFALYGASSGVLHVLGSPFCAIQTVGGAVVMLSGMRSVLNLNKENRWGKLLPSPELPLVAPVALPLIIGPSWLAAFCILVGKHYNFSLVCGILIISWFLISLATILLQVGIVGKGRQEKTKVLLATQTILGLFVTIIGAQLLLSGLQQAFL